MEIASLFAGLGAVWGGLFVGIFIVYFVLLFFLGMVMYYFTGEKPGKGLLTNMMSWATRLYSHTWMFVSSLVFLLGLAMLIKVIIGAMFPSFTYAEASKLAGKVSAQTSDFQIGLILFILSILIFAIHWGLAYIVENAHQRRGSVVAKSFLGFGLFTTGTIFFGSLLVFIMQFIAYAQTSASTRSVSIIYPGSSFALYLATLPVWIYYVVRSVMISKREGRR